MTRVSGFDDLQMRRRIRAGRILQRLHRGIDAARAVRHAGRRQAHLDARERPEAERLCHVGKE